MDIVLHPFFYLLHYFFEFFVIISDLHPITNATNSIENNSTGKMGVAWVPTLHHVHNQILRVCLCVDVCIVHQYLFAFCAHHHQSASACVRPKLQQQKYATKQKEKCV